MADNYPTTQTYQFVNNSTQATTVNKGVIQVVVDNKVVIDPKDLNPGVINAPVS